MKKNFFAIVMTTATVLSSCSEKEAPVVSETDAKLVPMTFTANLGDSKTRLDVDGLSVVWKAGDKIKVYSENCAEGTEFSTSSDNTLIADFEGTGVAGESEYFAYYPADGTTENTFRDSAIYGNLTTSARGCRLGTFPMLNNLMVAHADAHNNIYFKQVCALLKITIPESITDLKNIYVYSNKSGESISGAFHVNVKNGQLETDANGNLVVNLDETTGNGQAAIISVTSGAALDPGTYYIPVLPRDLTCGLRLKSNFSDNSYVRSGSANHLKLEPGKIYNFGTLTRNHTFNVANFQDDEVPASIIVANAVNEKEKAEVVDDPAGVVNNKALKIDCTAWTTSTTGKFGIKFDESKVPATIRLDYNAIQMRVFVAKDDNYYPYLSNKDGVSRKPITVDGITLGTPEAPYYSAALTRGEWHTVVWTAAQFDLENLSAKMFNDFRVNALVDNANNGTASGTRCIYFDDMKLIKVE